MVLDGVDVGHEHCGKEVTDETRLAETAEEEEVEEFGEDEEEEHLNGDQGVH